MLRRIAVYGRRVTFRIAVSGAILVLLAGCSTGRDILKWAGLASPKDKASERMKNDMEQFFSKIRPARGNADAHYLLGSYHQERAEYQKAIEEFKIVISIDSGYVKAYNAMGVCYDLLEDYPSAAEAYRSALRLEPDLDYVQNNLGYSLFLQGDWDGAISAFRNAVALDPQNKRFHNNLGLAYGEKGESDRALVEFSLAGDWVSAHYNMARLHYKKGEYESVISHYTIALEYDPSSTLLQSGLEAARMLAGVFQRRDTPVPEKRELMMPDETPITRAEGEVIAAADPFISENTLGTIPVQTAQASLPTEEAIDRKPEEVRRYDSLKGVGVEISNGNGANRMARQVGDYLKKRGVNVIRLTNADHFNYTSTRMFYYAGYDEEADYVAEQLPLVQDLKAVKQFDRRNVKIKVLIGRDMIPQKKVFLSQTG